MSRKGIAARAAHWSATHRKTAIFGWLGFVVVAFMIGNVVSQKEIHGADRFSGESGDAEQMLYDSGLRPNDEVVIVQDETLTIKDPEFRTTIEQLTDRLSRTDDVIKVESPLNGGGAVSADGHSALVNFEITGDDLEAKDRIEPSQSAVEDVQAVHPDLFVEQFGSVSTQAS